MTDCFFSYKSDDRERVRLIRDALADLGFDVFWDQEVPPGTDWDSWIKLELQKSRLAVAFWSTNSIHSANVRQEATIAHNSGKLIQVLLEPLTPEQFPMGLYTTQAINLVNWGGLANDGNWTQFVREIETRATPRWIRNRILSLENEIMTEQTKRQIAETRETNLQLKFVEEVAAHKAAELATDEARATVEPLSAAVESLAEGKRVAEASMATVERKVAGLLTSLETLENRANVFAQQPFPGARRSLLGTVLLIGVVGLILIGQTLYLLAALSGDPSVGNLHAEIAVLKAKLAAAESTTAKVSELQAGA
jgi:hypothetical protein